MKIVLTSAFMVMVFITGHAQEYQSIVYLLNGSIVRGHIIERVPEDYLKIETQSGRVRTIYMEDVKKITRESANKSNTEQSERKTTASSRGSYSQNRTSSRVRSNYDDNESDDYYDDESSLHRKGEKAIGVSVGYGSEIESIAIGAKFNYGITDQIRLSPSFNYFLGKDGLSEWEINADVHYLFNIAPKVAIYPLAGLTFVGWRFDWGGMFEGASSTTTRFGANVGAGIGTQLTDNIGIGLEVKYSVVSDLDQFVPSINLTYKF
jgi:outer membrane protein X